MQDQVSWFLVCCLEKCNVTFNYVYNFFALNLFPILSAPLAGSRLKERRAGPSATPGRTACVHASPSTDTPVRPTQRPDPSPESAPSPYLPPDLQRPRVSRPNRGAECPFGCSCYSSLLSLASCCSSIRPWRATRWVRLGNWAAPLR